MSKARENTAQISLRKQVTLSLVSTLLGDFKCCLKVAAYPKSRLDLISRPVLIVVLGSVDWECT